MLAHTPSIQKEEVAGESHSIIYMDFDKYLPQTFYMYDLL